MHHHTYEILRGMADLFPEDQYVLFFDAGLLTDPSLDRRLIDTIGGRFEAVPLRAFGPTVLTAEIAWLHWHLPQAIIHHGIELFHGFSHALPYTTRCPLVLTVHDLMPVELLSWHRADPLAAGRRRRLVSAVRRANGICAVSKSTQRDVQALLPGTSTAVHVVPNAIRDSLRRVTDVHELQRVATRYQLPPAFLLTVGADTPRRNYSNLVDALAGSWESAAAAPPLVVVGAARWSETRLFRHVVERGLRDRVTFLDAVPDADLPALYSLATTYVCPSVLEGFAMPVLEAMGFGTPVACSDLPVLHELAGDTATYFPPTDIAAMGRALVAACTRPAPSRADREALVAKAHRFSWRASARIVRDLYEQLLPSSTARSARVTSSRAG